MDETTVIEQLRETLEKIRSAAGLTNATVMGRKIGMDSQKLHQVLLKTEALLQQYFGEAGSEELEGFEVMIIPGILDLREDICWSQLAIYMGHSQLVPKERIQPIIKGLREFYRERKDA